MAMIDLLEESSGHFQCEGIPLTDQVWHVAALLIAMYNLKMHDATYLATASLAEMVDMASFDRGYRRVDRLFLWNDGIFGTQAP